LVLGDDIDPPEQAITDRPATSSVAAARIEKWFIDLINASSAADVAAP
jgi:hypothetical protein